MSSPPSRRPVLDPPAFAFTAGTLGNSGTPGTAPNHQGLAHMLMRRSVVVVCAVLLVAGALGVLRMNQDIAEEVQGAQALTSTLQSLADLESMTDAQARARLQELQAAHALRHVEFCVFDEFGRSVTSARKCPASAPAITVVQPGHARWNLQRAEGANWQVWMRVSEQAERTEALEDLLASLALLVVGAIALLGVIRWNLKRVFHPLEALLGGIAGVEREDHDTLKQLPAMPVRELERIAAALRHLAAALEEAQTRRRVLSRQMLTLQEDERARLARELHDELGQRLTSMRVDAAWLLRKLPTGDPCHEVLRHLESQCEDLQVDVRQLLQRLRPLGAMPDDANTEPASRLAEVLEHLVKGWVSRPSQPVRMGLDLSLPNPDAPLPRTLLLAVHRLSQEALTNVARHAQAMSARLSVSLDAEGTQLAWEVRDDGVGLADATQAMLRGSGLAGMQERVHALGGRFEWGGASESVPVGLRLRATFDLRELQPVEAARAELQN